MNEGAPTVKAGTYRNPETGSPRRGRLTGRWLPLSAGTTEGGREGGLAWTRRISPLHQGLFRMIGGEGLACHTGVAAFASASSSVLRPLTLTRCSRRMRRSSTAEAGSSCTLCPDGTIFSLALQSRWDEWYLTTPSEELGVSFLPLSPMME